MKKAWTRAVSAACAAILCILAAFAPVYASDMVMDEAAAVVTDDSLAAAIVPDGSEAAAVVTDDSLADAIVPDGSEAAAVVPDDSEAAAIVTDDFEAAESTMTIIDEEILNLPENVTGASDNTWVVGDNVTAEIISTNLYFYSDGGQLYDNWKEIIEDDVLEVESVSLSGGKMYLPEDSSFLFENMVRLKNIDLSGADTSHVNDMAGMFADLPELTRINLSGFDTSGVLDMCQMFYGCGALTSLDLSGFSTSRVTDMYQMFSGCGALKSLDLTGFSTSRVTDMEEMFSGCGNLTELDLRTFDTTKAATADMFLNCSKLAKLVTPKASSSSIKLPRTMYDVSGKSYTSLPALTSSITLTAVKPSVTPAPTQYAFSDVQDPSHAFFKAIYWAADAGITKGYPDGTFGINRNCTRGEMMMFLWRYAAKPAAKPVSKSPFKDVPKTHAFYNAILWGSQKGITKGYSDGTFGIERNVSRGECMMFLWRLKGKPAPKAVSKSPFTDVAKTHAFYNAILWGYQNKITNGYTSGVNKGKFGIDENCTRGQIVTFLYRAR